MPELPVLAAAPRVERAVGGECDRMVAAGAAGVVAVGVGKGEEGEQTEAEIFRRGR